jgi:hypothetical protein
MSAASEGRQDGQFVTAGKRCVGSYVREVDGTERLRRQSLTSGQSSHPLECVAYRSLMAEGELYRVETKGFGVTGKKKNSNGERG